MNKIKEIVLQFFNEKDIEVDNLSDNDDILFSGIIDSFQIVELIGFLEAEFNIEFNDDDINEENFKTIGKIIELVTRKI